jgi:hypothetical protein
MMRRFEIAGFVLVVSVVLIPVFLPAGTPDWSVNPPDYQYTGSVTSSVYREMVDVGSEGDILGAFVGDQCRGVVGALQSPGLNYLFLITVYSNEAAGESLSFRYYDSGMDVICHIDERVEFTADMTVGSIMSPIEMNVDGCQPLPPSSPIPCNGCWQDTVAAVAWDGGDPDAGDSVVYYIHLGTEAEPPIYDTTDVYAGSVTAIIYDLPPLSDGVIYNWQIVAEDKQGMTTTGPVWSFSMGPGATEPTPWGRIKMLFD